MSNQARFFVNVLFLSGEVSAAHAQQQPSATLAELAGYSGARREQILAAGATAEENRDRVNSFKPFK